MHPLLGFLESTPPVAGQDLLERLLDGRLDPGDAPAGYGGLARLVAAASAPATPEELAGERQALAEFAAVMPSPPPATVVPRRAAMPRKLFTIKAAAAALVAVLSIGGVAVAATGLLPSQARRVADQAPSTTAAGRGLGSAAVADLDTAARGLCRAWQAAKGAGHGRRADTPAFEALAAAAGGADNIAGYCADVTAGSASDHGRGRRSAVGPDATAAARAGLCRAWQAAKGAGHGRRADTPAFEALAAAAGGADNIAGYCADVTAGSASDHGQGQASPPGGSPPSTEVSPPSSGPPPDAGQGGHGQSGPPTTTG